MTDPVNTGLPDWTSLLEKKDDKQVAKLKDSYYDLKQLFLEYIPETQFPTYDEWVEMVDGDKLHEPTLGLIPGPGTAAAAAAAGAAGSFARKVGMDAFAKSNLNWKTADDALKDMRGRAERFARRRAQESASRTYQKFTNTGDGGTSKGDFVGGTRFNPTGLSQTLKPIDTSFSTDIKFQGQTRYWQDGKENSGPLFIKSGVPGLISTADNANRDSQIWDFISGPIRLEWNTAIAKRVTWTKRVIDLLTEIKVSDYINRCVYVCCVYYFWRSVIAFTDDPRNRNRGMDRLRDQLTPTDYNNLFNLRREMMQTAIPPFIHEFCFYMMGNYRQNHLPTSPLMKLMPFSFATTTNAYFDGAGLLINNKSAVDRARGHLSQLIEFNNVLSRAIGDWGGIEPFEYQSSPRVDFDFTTFWTNAGYTATNTTGVQYYPRVGSKDDEIVYNIHNDAPDGWVSAMPAPYVTTNGDFGVGLFHNWILSANGDAVENTYSEYSSTKSSTCFIYNSDSTAGFYPIESAQTYQALSGNTYNTISTSGNYHKFQRFGTERVILTSINALRQANFQFLELLYTQDLRNLGPARSGIVMGKEVNPSKIDKSRFGGRKRGNRRARPSMKDNDSDSAVKDEL